jgi:hypothetical protein
MVITRARETRSRWFEPTLAPPRWSNAPMTISFAVFAFDAANQNRTKNPAFVPHAVDAQGILVHGHEPPKTLLDWDHPAAEDAHFYEVI